MERLRLFTRNVGVALGTVVLALALPARGVASPIIQDTSNEARNISPFAGQSFTAEDAAIGIAGVYVVDFTLQPGTPATDATIVYELYAGVYLAGGTLLASRTFSGLTEGFAGFADVSFAGVALTPGSIYSLVVTNDTAEWGVASVFPSAYGGGTALLPPAGDPGLPPRDLRFHVLPAAVPEPGAMLLLAVACGGVLGRRVTIARRRREV